jgi:hypothetical protein
MENYFHNFTCSWVSMTSVSAPDKTDAQLLYFSDNPYMHSFQVQRKFQMWNVMMQSLMNGIRYHPWVWMWVDLVHVCWQVCQMQRSILMYTGWAIKWHLQQLTQKVWLWNSILVMVVMSFHSNTVSNINKHHLKVVCIRSITYGRSPLHIWLLYQITQKHYNLWMVESDARLLR